MLNINFVSNLNFFNFTIKREQEMSASGEFGKIILNLSSYWVSYCFNPIHIGRGEGGTHIKVIKMPSNDLTISLWQ